MGKPLATWKDFLQKSRTGGSASYVSVEGDVLYTVFDFQGLSPQSSPSNSQNNVFYFFLAFFCAYFAEIGRVFLRVFLQKSATKGALLTLLAAACFVSSSKKDDSLLPGFRLFVFGKCALP